MLDYAANAVVYWPVQQLRAEFEQSCLENGKNPEEEVRDRLGLVSDAEVLWQQVKTNLQAGRIRMLFVADRIPAELRRIVEFLNEQMDPAEVLALELRQFQGEGVKTIVPTVYGQTEEAQQKKGAPQAQQWDEASIFAEISRHGPEVLRTAQKIAEWTRNTGEISYGRGRKDGSFGLRVAAHGLRSTVIVLYTYGRVEITFPFMQKPFDTPAKQEELREQLNKFGIKLSDDPKRPHVELKEFSNDEEKLGRFLNLMDGCIRELRSA
jgi:hypothetical protein